jgi:hypothetical protein
MSVLPQLERELVDAAARSAPPPRPARARRRRVALLAAALVLLAAAVAVGRGSLLTGGGIDRNEADGPGRVFGATVRLLPLRAADPQGGPPWGIRTFSTSRRAQCWQVGRIVDNRLGLMGDDGRFRELPLRRYECRSVDANGRLFALSSAVGLKSGLTTALPCAPASPPVATGGIPACAAGSVRRIRLGFLGPLARKVERVAANGRASRVPLSRGTGAFLVVEEGLGRPGAVLDQIRVTYADGTTRPVSEPPMFESVPNAPAEKEPAPPGYADPAADVPKGRALRRPLRVTTRVVGPNRIFTFAFRAPVAARRYGLRYFLTLDGPARGSGRGCDRPLHFGGFSSTGDIRAGQTVRLGPLTPGVAWRWNKGWCPGRYTVSVVLHDPARVVGRYRFGVRRR